MRASMVCGSYLQRLVRPGAWLVLATLTAACADAESDDDGSPPACTPGETQECVGPGACEGAQVCIEDGSGFEACDCGPQGGGGSGPSGVCDPGETEPCYSGPAGTEDVGVCAAGTRTCATDGSEFGSCEGETLPVGEDCATVEDDDCDGTANDGCACTPGDMAPCYEGDVGTEGVGLCTDGLSTCNDDGSAYGACEGQVLPTPESCFTAADEDCSGPVLDCGQSLWSRRYGDAQAQQGSAIAADALGNVFFAANFRGNVDVGGGVLQSAGAEDVLLAKLDANGGHLWSKRFGDAQAQLAASIAVDGTGAVTLVGSFNGAIDLGGGTLTSAGLWDVFVAKFDSAGNHLWSKAFGNPGNALAHTVGVDAAGNVVLVGRFDGSLNFGGGAVTATDGTDLFMAKLSASGAHVWSKLLVANDGVFLAVAPAGDVAITGYFDGQINFGGGPLNGAGGPDIFVARFDTNGNHSWSKRYGDAGYQVGRGIAIDVDGNVVFVGDNGGSVDFGGVILNAVTANDQFLAKLDATGNHIWSNAWTKDDGGQVIPSGLLAVKTDSQKRILVAGAFPNALDFGGASLQSAGGADVFAASFREDGEPIWARAFGDVGDQTLGGLAVDSSDHPLVSVGFAGTVNFGNGGLNSAGDQDIGVARLAP